MKEYYLGLDMGTSSIGWAVTNSCYELVRLKGKDAWGVRLFEEAQTSGQSGYRSNRLNRRRQERSNARIGLLKLYFHDEIEKIDPLFYIRLENSKYYLCDKDTRLKNKNAFFDDDEYKDKDYFKEYPTIFHLRQALIDNNDAPYDVRLVFLAILNMFKHRGHFLLNTENDELDITMVDDALEAFFAYAEDELGANIKHISSSDVLEVLSKKNFGKKAKAEKLSELFEIGKNKEVKVFVELLSGSDSSSEKLFGYDKDESVSIKFSSFSYDDTIPEIQEKTSEDEYAIIEQLKIIYDFASVSSLLENGKYQYISEARVGLYEKHENDLKVLKTLYRKYSKKLPEKAFFNMFRSKNAGSYSAYVNFVSTKGKKNRRDFSGRDYENLKTAIKKDFKAVETEKDVQNVLMELDNGTFLPKQLTGANGTIPNQIHRKELKKILSNAETYLPFLKEKDESGLTVSERIISLFSFQIPYYIGPTGTKSKNAWAVRKESGAILPWNIWDKIDKTQTSERFITTMIRTCTYLNDEKVLPKQSLLYEEYCVLNEINNLKINGERIDTKTKKQIFNDLFLIPNGKKIKKDKIAKYLIGCGKLDSVDELTGVDETLNSYLSSYGKMYAIFGERLHEDAIRRVAEDIIYYGTIYGDSKAMFRESIEKYVSNKTITEENLKRILGYKFKDWGKLSKEMLLLCACDKSSGEEITLIQAMREYSLNFMELINSEEFTFKESLNGKQYKLEKTLSDFEYEDLDDYYFSAPVKRMVWQTILLVREIAEITGNEPQRVFIEMTRTDGEKGKRTVSRGKQLLELYKTVTDQLLEIYSETKPVNLKMLSAGVEEADKNGSLNSKKLYLYYMQLGKDMYTGEDINLSELFTTKYDIDHIYPRSKAGKDDSLINNLVLVNKTSNADVKKDIYPIPDIISSNPKVRALWDLLHSIKTEKGQRLISDEKYARLTRRTPLTDEELAKFIARQLVETSQATKSMGKILSQLMPNTTIVYSKAGNVSDFRRDNDFLKSRIVNEFHHAKDAYLNVVVGNAYYTKFTQSPRIFIDKEFNRDREKNRYNLDSKKMFERNIERNGKVAWIAGKDGSIKTVSRVIGKNSPLISKMTYDTKGAFYNIQPVSHKTAKADNYAPLKEGMAQDLYGGYQSVNPSYFAFIEYETAKCKKKRLFESVSVLAASKIKSDEDLKYYFEDKYGYSNVRILCSHIKKESLIVYNGYSLYIAGLDSRKNVEFHNATSLKLNTETVNYIHLLEKTAKKGKLKELDNTQSLTDKDDEQKNTISLERNLGLFEEISKRYSETVLKAYPRNIATTITNCKDKFAELSLAQQSEALIKLIKITSFEKGSYDLSELGLPKDVGRIRIGVDASKATELSVISKSITGLNEKVIDLLSL